MASKRKRNKPEKPRSVALTFQMGSAIATSLEVSGGEIIFRNAEGQLVSPKSGKLQSQYPRTKGPKVLSASPMLMDQPLYYAPDYNLLPYDTILAVDSNTRTIKGIEVSVASIVACRWRVRDLPSPIADVGPTQAIELRGTTCHPDLIAWKHVLKGVGDNPEFKPEGKLALIVDSHLGDLEDVQARRKPILGDFYLPEWATLFYASDAAADSFVNKVLRTADKHSRELLDQLERYPALPNSNLIVDDHCTYFHLWGFIGT
jgi:hypothetical protein